MAGEPEAKKPGQMAWGQSQRTSWRLNRQAESLGKMALRQDKLIRWGSGSRAAGTKAGPLCRP